MLVPPYIRLRYWFYPIGNTPAVNLLRDRAPQPEASTLKILCLACGDVRNILFTLSTEIPSAGRSYEATFCDSEPAVLARNVFALTFLAAGSSTDSTEAGVALLWELYYHIFISSDARSALAQHSSRLLEASTSSTKWNRSSFGVTLQFYSERSLREIRRFWELYLDGCENDKAREIREAVQGTVKKYGLDDGRIFQGGTRSTGVHALSSASVMSIAFRAYWKTGVVAGNNKDLSALENDHGGHANPLFYISSAPVGQFAVHYGTDPLLGFHVAEVFDVPGEEHEMLQRLASAAKLQFLEWCRSFDAHVRLGTLRLIFHCGEAVSLCYELQRLAGTNDIVPAHLYTYLRPWSSVCLDLSLGQSSDASHFFDVIDTSNISDHVGILNLLPAVRPLLNDGAFPVLYTETLLRAAEETTKYLDELLRVDVGSLGLIAGIAPTAALMGISSEHFGSEIVRSHCGRNARSQTQMRVRMSWTIPSEGDDLKAIPAQLTVSATADDVAALLFRWYLNIFSAFENVSMQLSVHFRRTLTPLSHDLSHYTRTTLVALIGLAHKYVQTDWSKCIGLLLDKIQGDRTLIVGSNSLQELYMLLHLVGIYKVSALEMSPEAAANIFSAMANPININFLTGRPDMPSVVAVALVVPRDRLHIFTAADLDRIGTPAFHLAVYNEKIFENSFHAIHACFGKLVIAHDNHTGIIDEDTQGWKGLSELIVVCLVPAFQFLVGDQGETRVALVMNSSAANTYFIPILGPHLRVFDTSIDNGRNFHILDTLPGTRQSQMVPVLSTQPGYPSDEPIASIASEDDRLQFLTLRENFSDKGERDYLKSGSEVQTTQESPCTVTIKLGKYCRKLHYPFPVDGSRSRTRIARKQLWVEVTVPISLAPHTNGYALRPFPIVCHNNQCMAWGLGRINLDNSPCIAQMSPKSLTGFLAMTLSARERDAHSPDVVTNHRSLFELKESLAVLFGKFASDNNSAERKLQAFRLAVRNDSDTIILVSSLRHDKDSGSICLDAHVVPLTAQRLQSVSRILAKTMKTHHVLGIQVSEREEILWKHVMPAFIERCRYSWQHKPTCEYLTPELACPRTVLHGEVAICSCGEGQDVASIPQKFREFSRFATRIAIAPLSAVPFIELMALDSILSAGEDHAAHFRHENRTNVAQIPENVCGHCGSADSDLKACDGCKSVRYCNRRCQKQAWRSHKVECKSKRLSLQ